MVFDVVFEIIEKAQPIYAALYQETKAFVFSCTDFNIRRETRRHEREGGSKIIRRRFMFKSKFSTNKALHAPNS